MASQKAGKSDTNQVKETKMTTPERKEKTKKEAKAKKKVIATSKDVRNNQGSPKAQAGMIKAEFPPNIRRLLRIRKLKQKQRPQFRKPESWRLKRIPSHWRFPHGIDNKTIRKWKCGSKIPVVGYRGPRLVRGMHPCGLHEKVVNNLNDIEKLDPKVWCIKIGARVGARKRISLIEKLREKHFKILNLGMTEKEFQEFQSMLEEKSTQEEAIEK